MAYKTTNGENELNAFTSVWQKNCNCHISNSGKESEYEEYFNIKIKNKNYPSCYRFNVLVMLAKRLISEQKEINNASY